MAARVNYSETGRALLRPEEILTLNNDYVIVLQRGMPPILADRVKWYADPEFNPALPKAEAIPALGSRGMGMAGVGSRHLDPDPVGSG